MSEVSVWEEIRRLQARVRHLEGLEYTARAGVAERYRAAIGDALFCCHFDGPEPFATDYTLNTHGHRGQAATRTGGVIGRPGRFGKAVQIAEATTNLLPNPSVETNTTGFVFAHDGTAPVRERSAAAAWIGSYGLRWVLGATPGGARVQQATGAAPSAAAYTFSVRARAQGAAIGKTVRLAILATGGAQPDETGYGADVTLTADWQTLTLTYTVTQADRTNLYGRLTCLASAAGDELHLDGWQMEQKAIPTPYCDGSLGAGHSWTGTAHASTSTRAAAGLSYPSPGRLQSGTVMLWSWADAPQPYRYLFAMPDGAGKYVYVRLGADGQIRGLWGSSEVNSGTYPAATWVHIALTRDADGTVSLYENGLLTASGYGGATDGIPGTLNVGRWLDAQLYWNGLIDDLVIVGRCLDAAEVRAVYESNAPALVITDPVAFGSIT